MMLQTWTVIHMRNAPVEASPSHSALLPSTQLEALVAGKRWLAKADFCQCSSSHKLRCEYKVQLSQLIDALLYTDCMQPQTVDPQCMGLILEFWGLYRWGTQLTQIINLILIG